MAKQGALAKDPKATSSVPTKAANRAIYDTLSPAQQAEYSRLRASQGGQKALQFLKGAGQQPVATTTPEGVTESGFLGAGGAYQGMLDRFQGQQYQPQFEQEMERARQNVMGQFERRNNQAFAQQRQDFETSMANKGIAPGSQQYKLELEMLNDRQDMARQEAMGAAEQAAYGVQQQQFSQAADLAMRPYEQWGILQQPYMAGIQAQYQSREAQLQRQFEEAMRRGDRASAERIARMSRSGGGGGGGLDAYQRMEIEALNNGYQQGQQINPGAAAVGGMVQGVTGQVTNRLTK